MKPFHLVLILALGLLLAACTMVPGLAEGTPTLAEPPAAPTATAVLPTPTLTAGPTTTPGATTTAAVTPPPSTAAPTPQGAWIKPLTDAGKPGQVIQIEGYLPGGLVGTDLAAEDYITHADIYWGGFPNGVDESVEITWSKTEPGRYSLPYIVPPIPWLAADGLHLNTAGDYTLDLIHLDPSKYGCKPNGDCTVTPDASASFHLTQDAPHPPCAGQTCGSLSVSPTRARPGEKVTVTGWAPLLEIIGTPFDFDGVLITDAGEPTSQNMYSFNVQQAMDGTISGSFLVPQTAYTGQPLAPGTYRMALRAGNLGIDTSSPDQKKYTPVLINFTSLQVEATPPWIQVRRPVPLWIAPSADLNGADLATDPLHPERMAYCGGGKIMLTENAGQSWSVISTEASNQLSPDPAAAFWGSACVSVTLDSAHPGSFYAVFTVVSKQYGAPPIYYVGAYTSDRGKTWQLAPVTNLRASQQFISGNFGGFWTDGTRVEALSFGASTAPGQSPPLEVKQTVDGGLTWSASSLACPSTGPCVRWGSAPSQGGGMGAPMPQSVLASVDAAMSADGGQTWQDTDQSVELRMTGPHELVALDDRQAVLISGTEAYALRYTADAGKTWQALALPPLPETNPGYPQGYPGLQMLPDGSLMTLPPDSTQWLRLAPSAQDWCPTGLAAPDKNPALLRVSGDRVWWLSGMDQQVQSASVNALRCVQ